MEWPSVEAEAGGWTSAPLWHEELQRGIHWQPGKIKKAEYEVAGIASSHPHVSFFLFDFQAFSSATSEAPPQERLQQILWTDVSWEGLCVKDGQKQVTAYEKLTPHPNERNDKNYSSFTLEPKDYLWGCKENCLGR